MSSRHSSPASRQTNLLVHYCQCPITPKTSEKSRVASTYYVRPSKFCCGVTTSNLSGEVFVGHGRKVRLSENEKRTAWRGRSPNASRFMNSVELGQAGGNMPARKLTLINLVAALALLALSMALSSNTTPTSVATHFQSASTRNSLETAQPYDEPSFQPAPLVSEIGGWQHMNVPNPWFVSASGGASNTVYASSGSNAIFRSANGGDTWELTQGFPLSTTTVSGVGLLTTPDRVYVTTEPYTFYPDAYRLYVTNDSGNSWSPLWSFLYCGQFDSEIYKMTISPSSPDTLYAIDAAHDVHPSCTGIIGGNFFRSIDGGNTWSQSASNPCYLNQTSDLAVDPIASQTIYASCLNGYVVPSQGVLYRSNDGGDTWSQFAAIGVSSVSVIPASPYPLVFALTPGGFPLLNYGIIRTQDGGATWEPVNTGLPPLGPQRGQIDVLIQHPTAEGTLYAILGPTLYGNFFPITSTIVYATEDAGATWYQATQPLVSCVGCNAGGKGSVTFDINSQSLFVVVGSDLWRVHPGVVAYSIAGQVRDVNNNPIPAITIISSAGISVRTDENGNYFIPSAITGTYTITASDANYTPRYSFSPISRTVSVPPIEVGQDFIGTTQPYSISGRIRDVGNNPISGVTISAGSGGNAVTNSSGYYTIINLIAGTYAITPTKFGYTFSPPTRSVSVPPDATGQDFVGTGHDPNPSGLAYEGPFYLSSSDLNAVPDEPDHRITMGDHVHLRLPFRNSTSQTIFGASVELQGSPQAGNWPGISIYNGVDWGNTQIIDLSPAIPAGMLGYADFWIFVDNIDPTQRTSLYSHAWLKIATDVGLLYVRIPVDSIAFDIQGQDALLADSCLHNPDNPAIQRYAQFAAGAKSQSSPPSNAGDPDVPSVALRNLVNTVGDRANEFAYKEDDYSTRVPDIELLSRRGSTIGQCRHYADLTTGLVRSLGIPARLLTASFIMPDKTSPSHAWVEAYLGPGVDWKQLDPTAQPPLYDNPQSYERDRKISVQVVRADQNPLSSASTNNSEFFWCIDNCYKPPVNCILCRLISNFPAEPPWWIIPNKSCMDIVTARYKLTPPQSVPPAFDARQGAVNSLRLNLQAPIYVTRTVPFSLSVGIVNNSTLAITEITATVSISEYIDSKEPLLNVEPLSHTISSIAPGQMVTVTWTITPSLARSTIPLRVAVFGNDVWAVSEQTLTVNEPGTLPDLQVIESCSSHIGIPGQSITLTTSVLGEYLQPITDTATMVTATVYSTPTTAFTTTVTLGNCGSCQAYQQVLNLPADAPIGLYHIEYAASRVGYDPAYAASTFFVVPTLSLSVTTSQTTLDAHDVMTLTAQVYDRGAPLADADLRARILTPSGTVTVPVILNNGHTYLLAFRPVDFVWNFNGQVTPGIWQIQVIADYQGAMSTTQTAVTVMARTYLPLIRR